MNSTLVQKSGGRQSRPRITGALLEHTDLLGTIHRLWSATYNVLHRSFKLFIAGSANVEFDQGAHTQQSINLNSLKTLCLGTEVRMEVGALWLIS